MTSDVSQWITIDLGSEMFITAVVTQGRAGGIYWQWVTSYTVEASLSATFTENTARSAADTTLSDSWYVSPRSDSADTSGYFIGNSDYYSKVYGWFDEVVKARYIRIRPMGWYAHISMRAGVLSLMVGSRPSSR